MMAVDKIYSHDRFLCATANCETGKHCILQQSNRTMACPYWV